MIIIIFLKVDQNGLALSRTYYLSNLTDPVGFIFGIDCY